MASLRQRAQDTVRRWSARRHGRDSLPMAIKRGRIYILPTGLGFALGVMLLAMLLAGLNYNSNLGLAFAFLMASLALVIMHHCNRNMQTLIVDTTLEVDAFAGRSAAIEFVVRNDSRVERRDVEVRCPPASALAHVPAAESASIVVSFPVARRGITRIGQFEVRTRYPFGWFHSWTYVHTPLTVFVAPEPKGERSLPSVEGNGAAARAEKSGDEDFSGLRSYQPGVPLKHMAWKVLARGGDPAVRSYSSLAAEPEWLEWSALEGLDEEARLSQLCLWVLESEARHRPYGLKIPGVEIPPSGGAAHRYQCLRSLACFGQTP